MSENILFIWDIFKIILDIALVTVVVYLLLRLIKHNARMMLLFKGIVVILLLNQVAKLFSLTTISYLLSYIISNGFLIIVIIFHPEIRTALEQLGRNRLFFGKGRDLSLSDKEKVIKTIKSTVEQLTKTKTGAIISIEQNESMFEFVSKGHQLFSDLSDELLVSIFNVSSPLHDGAVIIQGNKIACAKAYFPITQNPVISGSFGTRHRAAIGISEVSDCITIVVSEELGSISLTHLGVIFYDLTINELDEKLRESYLEGGVVNEYYEEEVDKSLVNIHDDAFDDITKVGDSNED